MRGGEPLGTTTASTLGMSQADLQTVVANTVAVMTTATEKRDEWRQAIVNALGQRQLQEADRRADMEFLTAVLAILDNEEPNLSREHPHAAALAAIQAGIEQASSGDEDSA